MATDAVTAKTKRETSPRVGQLKSTAGMSPGTLIELACANEAEPCALPGIGRGE